MSISAAASRVNRALCHVLGLHFSRIVESCSGPLAPPHGAAGFVYSRCFKIAGAAAVPESLSWAPNSAKCLKKEYF